MVTGQAAAPRGHDSAAAVTGAIVPGDRDIPASASVPAARRAAVRGSRAVPGSVSRCLQSTYDAATRLTN